MCVLRGMQAADANSDLSGGVVSDNGCLFLLHYVWYSKKAELLNTSVSRSRRERYAVQMPEGWVDDRFVRKVADNARVVPVIRQLTPGI